MSKKLPKDSPFKNNEIQKCIKCKDLVFNYEKLESGAYICYGCTTKEWLDYMTLDNSPWAKEAFTALKYLDELDELVYNLSQHNQALEEQIAEIKKTKDSIKII